MNRQKRFLTAGIFLAEMLCAALIATIFAPTTASAQYPPNHTPPVGRACEISATVTLSNGMVLTSGGWMDMNVTAVSPDSDIPHWQELEAKGFHSTGYDPMLGNISWDLDVNRQAPITRIEANDRTNWGVDFPATCDIYFYVIGTCSNFPGVIYTSTTPVHMRNKDLKTFNPHINETYDLVDPVDFEDAAGNIAFTVTGLTSILN